MRTKPRPLAPEGVELELTDLVAKRYGTFETDQAFGAEQTMSDQLYIQGESALLLSEVAPEVLPPGYAGEIAAKASLEHIDPDRIRELEEKTGHDIIAVNTSIEEQLSPEARPYVNKTKTSSDTTQPARALQLKRGLEIIIDSVENLRDVTIEKARGWIDIPHMDTSHLLDALPTVAARPFAHYVEMLQSNLDFLAFVYRKSIKGKWGDATGNHHGAADYGINGMELQKIFCKRLDIGHMTAAAQIPGLEFEADIMFALARTAETMNNIAEYLRTGKGSDVGIFFDDNPKRRKGSASMPHKDAAGGNPTAEEQVKSMRNYMDGNVGTVLANCQMPYARDLSASSNSRIIFEESFKYLDHCIRRLAAAVYHLGLDESRSKERVGRTFGTITARRVMNYLTDGQRVAKPMASSEAHDLMGELATAAYKEKRPFTELLLGNEKVRARMGEEKIRELSNPFTYIGQSKEITESVFTECYKKPTLAQLEG